MKIYYHLLLILGFVISSCVSNDNSSEQSFVRCETQFPPGLKNSIGIDSYIFTLTVPKSHLVTMWCEFYQDGQLNEDLSYYAFKNHPTNYNGGHALDVYEEMSMELRRIDPDYTSGQKTMNGVWSFGGGSGHLIKQDPLKTSTSSIIENLAKDHKIILSENTPTLLYYMVGVESGTPQWSDDKKWNIKN